MTNWKKFIYGIGIWGVIHFFILGAYFIYDMQYNSRFTSRYLSITLCGSTITKVGESLGRPVYIYNMSMPELETFSAKRISLDDALRDHSISMLDLCKYPRSVDNITEDGLEITSYSFENYKIVYGNNKYIIVPTRLTDKEIYTLMK